MAERTSTWTRVAQGLSVLGGTLLGVQQGGVVGGVAGAALSLGALGQWEEERRRLQEATDAALAAARPSASAPLGTAPLVPAAPPPPAPARSGADSGLMLAVGALGLLLFARG